MEDAADDDFVRAYPVEDDVLAVHELMRAAFIQPAHIRIIAEQFEHSVELAQVLLSLIVAEGLDGVAVDILEVAFRPRRDPMAHAL